jgi:hypothetical protein
MDIRQLRRDRPVAVSLVSYPYLLRGGAVFYTRVTFFSSVRAAFHVEIRQKRMSMLELRARHVVVWLHTGHNRAPRPTSPDRV